MFFLIFFDYVALLKVTYVPFSVGVKTMKKIAQNSHPNEVVLNHENADVWVLMSKNIHAINTFQLVVNLFLDF